MSLQIAESTFITKKDSKLAAVDIYGDIDKEAKNPGTQVSGITSGIRTPNIAGEINKLTEDLTKAFSGGGSFEDAMSRVKGILNNKDKLVDNLKDAISKDVLTHVGLGSQAGTITDILAGRKKPDELLGVVAGINPQMKIIVNGVDKIMNAKDLATATGITGLLSELTGDDTLAKVLDLSPEFLIFGQMLDSATSLRIPEIVDLVFNEVDDSQRSKLMISKIPKIARNSDIDTLEKINDRVGKYALNAAHPDIISDILANYKTFSGDNPTEEEIQQLSILLNNINERWWAYDRNGTTVYDLGVVSNLSEHAHFALSRLDEVKDIIALFNVYEPEPLSSLLDTYKPWITAV